MSEEILKATKLITKQEIINWYTRELSAKVSTAVSNYVLKEDGIFIEHMADTLHVKMDAILNKHFGKVLKEMADVAINHESTEDEHDFWEVGMNLENDISAFKHYKVRGLHRVINVILDSQAKKRRGTIVKMKINRAKAL
jgi:hypothetical protein